MKTTTTDTHVIVGKVGAPYGVRGWVKIQSFTDPLENILHYEPWFFAEKDQSWKEAAIESRQVHGQALMAKFTGIDTPEEARLLTGKIIAIIRTQLPTLKNDEYYWSELQGLTVLNKDGIVLGTVTSLMETGANDVLIVKGEKEFAVPYLPGKYILAVDLVKREIHVDWEPI
jgi:16S rRNA processing protein RimM